MLFRSAACVADGAFFVNLAPLTDPTLVLSTIAQTLGLRETADQPLLDTLISFLRDKALLLILDNWEHLLDAAPLVSDLLDACPHLTVLATSREPLHLQGEQEFPLGPLAVPAKGDGRRTEDVLRITYYPSVQLFVQRARAVKPDFALTEENAMAVADICRRLDGLPLAIELAAARVKALPPQAILQRLDGRLRLLTGGARDLPTRHQTLRNTLDWSYDLLTEAEKTLFRRLAVFMGGRTLEAVEVVCVDGEPDGKRQTADSGQELSAPPSAYRLLPSDILDLLTSLVDKSLLWTRQLNGETRYLMLVTIHEYAVEKLEESGEAEAIRQRHAEYFLKLAEEAEPKLKGRDQLGWLDRLEAEHDNLRAALGWTHARGEVEPGLQLAGALGRFWEIRGYLSEGSSWFETLLAGVTQHTPTPMAAKAFCYAGALAWHHGDMALARTHLEQAIALGRVLRDLSGLAIALHFLGECERRQGNLAAAQACQAESLAVAQQANDAWAKALALYGLGCVAVITGDYTPARARLEESLAIQRRLGDRWPVCLAVLSLGETARGQGDDAQATALYQQSLALAQELGIKEVAAVCLHNLGWMTLRQGERAPAAALFQASLTLSREIGIKYCLAWSLAGLAAVAGGTPGGVHLFGAAESLLEAFGGEIEPTDRPDYDHAVAVARTALSEAAFAAAWGEGRALSVEQAIGLALELASEAQRATEDDGRRTEEASPTAPPPSSVVRPPSTPLRESKERYGGLTAREREVATLIAQGLTNDEIADQMSVVVKTVEKHVGNILGKLAFENRPQVAPWA